MAIGVLPPTLPSASLTIGPWGDWRSVSVTGAWPLTAICCSLLIMSTHWPRYQTWLGLSGLSFSAIRSRSSFWNMVMLQPKSLFMPRDANGIKAW
ncbi:hypothetical protein D3C76_538370 [compost metagenome]